MKLPLTHSKVDYAYGEFGVKAAGANETASRLRRGASEALQRAAEAASGRCLGAGTCVRVYLLAHYRDESADC